MLVEDVKLEDAWARAHSLKQTNQSRPIPRRTLTRALNERTCKPSPRVFMFRIRPSISRILPRPCPGLPSRTQVRLATSSRGQRSTRKVRKEQWTQERLQVDEKYPLAAAVREATQLSQETRKRPVAGEISSTQSVHGVHLRTQIVSPDLCGTSTSGQGELAERDR